MTFEQFMAFIQANPIYLVLAFVGLIAGWLSGLLLGGGGLIRNLLVGLLGAYVGGLIVHTNPQLIPKIPIVEKIPLGNQIMVATIGAIIVTMVARLLAGRR